MTRQSTRQGPQDVSVETSWPDPFFVSVRGADADEITEYWTKLVEGSTVVQPLAPSLKALLEGQ